MSDFLKNYMPAAGDIPASQLEATRAWLQDWCAVALPGVDGRPSTPFGDLHLNGLAVLFSGLDTALSRLFSDAALEAPSRGVIWNCDWLADHLANLGVMDYASIGASGTVRLLFRFVTAPVEPVVLDRRLQFSFAEQAVFRMRLPFAGGMELLPPGTRTTPSANQRVLTDLGDGGYLADVPVTGAMATTVSAGTSALTDMVVDGLSSAVALVDFTQGTPPGELRELAARARRTFYAAGLNGRGGIVQLLRRELPDLLCVSPSMPGDPELLRASVSPFGVVSGDCDVNIHSTPLTDTVTVVLPYEIGSREWRGELLLPQPPSRILSVVPAADRSVLLERGEGGYRVYSSSSDPNLPRLTAARTMFERLWLRIPMPVAQDGSDLLPMTVNAGGAPAASFDITYEADPALPAAHAFMTSRDNSPGVLRPLVRRTTPVVFDTFEICYRRATGTTVNVPVARSEIKAWLLRLGYPDLWSYARLCDSLFFAGAQDVVGVTMHGTVTFSAADMVMQEASDPDAALEAAMDAAEEIPAVTVDSLSGMMPAFTDTDTKAACGPTTLAWRVPDDVLSFSEVTV